MLAKPGNALNRTMKKLLVIFLTVISFTRLSMAQAIEGLVKDAKTKAPLPYVNIGIIGKATGTVTDSEGRFNIIIGQADANDSVKVSMIGYQSKRYSVADFRKEPEKIILIDLLPTSFKLKEVKVGNRKFKDGVLGIIAPPDNLGVGFTGNKLGNEMAELIPNKYPAAFIRQFNAILYQNDEFTTPPAKLRLNFYSVKNGLPDQLLNDKNIFVTVNKGDKKISVDLTTYDIYADGDFFASLEYIESSPGRGLMFCSNSSKSAKSAFRPTSQANWNYAASADLGFTVQIGY